MAKKDKKPKLHQIKQDYDLQEDSILVSETNTTLAKKKTSQNQS